MLFCFPERHNAYAEALAEAVAATRPHVLVLSCLLSELEERVRDFDPHVVVSSEPNRVDPGGRSAWIQMATETSQPSQLCVAGDHSQEVNPVLWRVLAIVDEVDSLIALGERPEGC